MIRTPVRAAAAALCLIVALSGCSHGSSPVAKVGSHTLTVDDFARVARGNEANLPGPPEQAKAMLLRELVQRELVLVAAHVHGVDTLESTRSEARKTEEKLLLQLLTRQIAPPDMGVSEGEARALYEARKQQADVHLIYTMDEPTIRLAAKLLADGVPFARVADQVNETSVLPPGGALGLHAAGDLPQVLDQAVRTQPIGVIGGPWATPQGWFILKITSRVPASEGPYESLRSTLMEMIRQGKQTQAYSDAIVALKSANHLAATQDGPAMVFRIVAVSRAINAPHWLPNAAEQKLPVVTYDGGAYTLGDALHDLDTPESRGMDPSSLNSVRAWVEAQTISRLLLREARRRHIDQEPAVVAHVNDDNWNRLTEVDLGWAQSGVPAPDEATVRAVWDTVKNRYPQLQRAHLVWIATADTAQAGAVARAAATGMPLRSAARAAGVSLPVHDETVNFLVQDPAWSDLRAAVIQCRIGACTAPLFTGKDWRVIQVLDRVQGPLQWEQLPQQAQQQVAQGVGGQLKQQRVAAYQDSLWKAINPTLMPDNLRQLPWPVPGTFDVGM